MNDSGEVKLHFLDYWRIIVLRRGLIVLAFLLVMISAGVTTYFLPREYLSTVTMEVKEDNSGPVQIGGNSAPRGFNQQFVATQFRVLQTTEILYPVIDRLNLTREFSQPGAAPLPLQQVFFRLRRSMTMQEVRQTNLIEIGVYHTDAKLAANIANTIAVVYQEKRQSDLEQGVNRGLAQLEEEVKKQSKIVEEAATAAAQIRARDGITDPDVNSANSTPGTAEQAMIADATKVNEARSMVAVLTVQLQQIERLKPDELLEALRTLGIEDQTVMKNLPLLQDASAEEAKLLNSGLGENHPKVRALRAQMKVYTDILTKQLESIRRTQTTRLQIEQDKLIELEAYLAKSTKDQIDSKAKMLEYIDAKTRYLSQRDLFKIAEQTLSAERMKIGIQQASAKIWQRAEPSLYPSKPKVATYMIFAGFVGLTIGVGLAFFIEYLDTSVKTLDDVERFLQTPVLAVIPKGISALIRSRGDSADAEAYRILRANIEFNKPNRDANTFTLISGGSGEGKSTTLNNLAYVCAKGGYNVLVVDADLRRPSQHAFFDVENNHGLSDYLGGKADLEEIVRTTRIDNLSFIPSGPMPTDDANGINSQRMTDLVRKLKGQYDLVFFDSPPILGVSDGSVLASEVDMTLMVVQHRRFPRAMLQRVKQAVQNVGGRLIGVVLNNVDLRRDEGYAYMNAYKDYYAPKPEPARRGPDRAPAAATRPRGDQGDY